MLAKGRDRFVSGLLAGGVALLLAYAGDAAAQSTKDDAKCINAMNKNLQKVASTMGKDVSACIKNFGKGKTEKLGPEGTAEGCLSADVKGKVAKATGKTSSDFTKNCTEGELVLVNQMFGSDLDINLSTEKDPSKCQQAVIKAVTKCQDARMKSYNSCKKNALKAGVSDPSELAACIGDDAKGKISKACGKISGDVSKKCSGQDVAALFPGCGVATTGELTTCLEEAADCRACAAIKLADGLDATCSACIPSGAIGTAHCLFDARAWCVGGDRDGDPCTDALANSDCPGGGNCLSNARVENVIWSTSPNPVFDTLSKGEMDYVIGTPDPVTGRAPVSCSSPFLAPDNFGALIGWVCQTAFPTPDCGDFGVIDCDGGEPVDAMYEAFHDIGDCGLGDDPNETDPNNLAGPSQCRALCEARCASLSANHTVFASKCEGYCRFGLLDGTQCSNDVECWVPNTDPNDPATWDVLNSGECVGGEPVAHAKRCNCECREIGGEPSRPGAFACEEGLVTTNEIAPPCDWLDVTTISIGCAPRGTSTFTSKVTDPDLLVGQTFEPNPKIGWPASCRQLAQDNLGTQRMAGTFLFIDSGLGDLVSPLSIMCQGPGYDLTP
jgi:hypothetical protein